MKKIPLSKRTIALFAAAGLLMTGGTIGTTAAALTVESDMITQNFQLTEVAVTLLENGVDVHTRDGYSNSPVAKDLLLDIVPEGKKFIVGKTYPELISIRNDSGIPTYNRVIVIKKWVDENGNVRKDLDPDMIEIGYVETGWTKIQEDTKERSIWYCPGEIDPKGVMPLTNTIRVNPKVAEDDKYAGAYIALEVEVDGVQAKHGKSAIKSAWGVDVSWGAKEAEGTSITGGTQVVTPQDEGDSKPVVAEPEDDDIDADDIEADDIEADDIENEAAEAVDNDDNVTKTDENDVKEAVADTETESVVNADTQGALVDTQESSVDTRESSVNTNVQTENTVLSMD